MICLGFLILCSYLARCLRLVSESKLQRNNGVSIALDASFKVWLINESNENHTIASGELFGFGIGAYQEVSSGHLVSPLVQYVSILQWCPFPAHPVSTVLKGDVGNSAVGLIPWSVETCSGWACAVLTKRRSWLFPRSCVTSQRSGGPQRPVFWITTWSLFARRGIVQKPLKKWYPQLYTTCLFQTTCQLVPARMVQSLVTRFPGNSATWFPCAQRSMLSNLRSWCGWEHAPTSCVTPSCNFQRVPCLA